MGNQPINAEIQRHIDSLQLLKKHSSYSILKAPDQTEFIKFLYTPTVEQTQTNSSARCKTNSVFNLKYLQYRFECQSKLNKMAGLPQILAFGQEPEKSAIISCTGNKLNFVIFQHPIKTLKQEIQNRITSGEAFKQSELLCLVRSVLMSLSELFDHTKNWNEEILERKTFLVNEENIYVSTKGEFVVSDIISHFNEIEQLSKQEITLKKSSRVNSLTNLHAKVTGKKLRQKYFETNMNNLASIIEGIIFKFQCFNQPLKSLQDSQSLSTALQSHRGLNKAAISYSMEFDRILKDLRQSYNNERAIIQEIDKLLSAIHLPTPIQRSQEVSKLSETKTSIQKVVSKSISHQGIHFNAINSFSLEKARIPLGELQNFNSKDHNPLKLHLNKKSVDFQQFKTTQNYTSQNIETVGQKRLQRQSTKLRLSLKKDSQVGMSLDKKQPTVLKNQPIKRKNSHPKFLCARTNETLPKGKQNIDSSEKANNVFTKQGKKNSENKKKQQLTQKILNAKLVDSLEGKKASQPEKKKILLKKQNMKQNQKPLQPDEGGTKKTDPEPIIHLNPMSRKKTFGIVNKLLTFESTEKVLVYKTNEKSNQIDLDFIENLSSIVSNQNNTISSYGIPITDQFKTENSLIEDEGCIGFNQNDDQSLLKSVNYKTQMHENGQFSKKQGPSLSPPCVKLSSYPSLELVESIVERPEDKIPQFLKKFKLPQKNLLALKNIILKQKDVIVEESFEQSELNSIRHSVPNILGFEEQISNLKRKRDSKTGFEGNELLARKQKIGKDFESIIESNGVENEIKQSVIYEKSGDSLEVDLKFIEISLIQNGR